MKKIAKTLAVVMCMTLVWNLQGIAVFGEEIEPFSEIETEEKIEEGLPAWFDDEDYAVDETEDETETEMEDDTEEEDLEEADTIVAEEAVEYSSEPEETLGDNGAKIYKPYEGAKYELKYSILYDDTICITGYEGSPEGRLIIPSMIDRQKVTRINERAFAYCSGFTGDLVIPDSVKTVGQNAFLHCSGLNGSLKIGNGVEKLTGNEFALCGFTGNLIIGDGMKEIASNAFCDSNGFCGHLILGRNLGSNFLNQCNRGQSPFKEFCFRMVTNRSSETFYLGDLLYTFTDWIDLESGENTGSSVQSNQTVYVAGAYDALDADEFTHAPIPDQVYTGSPIKPAVEVFHRENKLIEKKDYTIRYSNNTNVGTADFTITGKGNFTGSASDTFRIVAKDIRDADISVAAIPSVKESKKDYKPVPSITYHKKKLKKGTDFEVTYHNSLEEAKNNQNARTPKEAGTYYARIEGINNFSNYIVKPFMIAANDEIPVNTLTVAKIKDKSYTGENITLGEADLNVKAKSKKDPLVFNQDYTVAYYSDAGCRNEIIPKNVGTYYVKITGVEEKGYVGTKTVSFKIVGTPIAKYKVEGFQPTLIYNGDAQEQHITLLDNSKIPADPDSYTVSYTEDTTNVGTVTMFITGTGGITGTLRKTYRITPLDVAKNADRFKINGSVPAQSYKKAGAMPVPAVQFRKENGAWADLTSNKDFILTYTNNKAVAAASGSKAPAVTVTGKGNFKGTNDNLKAVFEIRAADMSAEGAGFRVIAGDVVYSDRDGNWIQKKISVVDAEGKALKAGTDYEKTIEFYAGSRKLDPKDKLDAGTTITVKVTGKGNYTGTAFGFYRIAKQDISKLNVNAISKTYTGKDVTIKPSDIIWKAKGKIIHDVEVEIDDDSYRNNVKKGKATVVVRGTGTNYCGTKTITFGIGVRKIFWWWL